MLSQAFAGWAGAAPAPASAGGERKFGGWAGGIDKGAGGGRKMGGVAEGITSGLGPGAGAAFMNVAAGVGRYCGTASVERGEVGCGCWPPETCERK